MGQHHPDSISQQLVDDPKGLQGQLGNVDLAQHGDAKHATGLHHTS